MSAAVRFLAGLPAHIRRRLSPRWIVFGLLALVAFETATLALDLALPPDLGKARRSSPVALDRHGVWLRALPVEDGRWRIRADLSRTDPAFVRRLIRLEDRRFYAHLGVDPVALVRALAQDVVHARIVSGGSTLTMQTARMLEPRRRTVLAKAIEALRAVQLEARFSKAEILSLYLTLAPYGGNLEGVRGASLSWFGHEPESLTPGEQALLIALPQSPEARRPDRRPGAALAARNQVLNRLAGLGALPREEAREAESEPLPSARRPFPTLAWHAAGRLARHASWRRPTIRTTLDAALQARVEALARRAALAEGPSASAAVTIVEVRTRAVRAAVGSAGLDRPGGWIDMGQVLRSPGSALKPFVYALAFDAGLAAPDTRLIDAAVRFGDYQPENFDRTFHGEVTVREALTHSLNVPAVATLARLGPDAFAARIEATGARLVRPRARTRAAGLALALGGAGLSQADLAMLYAALADHGVARPLAWTEDDLARRPRASPFVRPEAADQVLDILRETPPPAGRAPAALLARGPRLAYKTGTSYGFRDALAVGVGGGYVAAVWTGRADGGARGGLTGRESAAPLLFDVFDAIDAPARAPGPLAPIAAPKSLLRLEAAPGPTLIFPPDGAEVFVERYGPASRGLTLAARGEGLRWFVDGRPLSDKGQGGVIWRPDGPGFYVVSAVDTEGRSVRARVRVRGSP